MNEPKKKQRSPANKVPSITARRTQLHCGGVLQTSNGPCRCIVNNISTSGAAVSLTHSINVGAMVSLVIPGLGNFRGNVVWQSGVTCGIRFTSEERVPTIGLATREDRGLH